MGLDINELKSKFQGMLGKQTPTEASEGQSAPKATKPKSASEDSALNKLLRKTIGKQLYKNEKILGVDITPHYVRICQLKNSYGKWILTNLASACMETQFRKTDIMMNPDAYAENLKELISKNKIKSKNIAFTAPTSSSVVKVLQFADMADEDFHEAVKFGAIWESAVNLEGGAGEYEIFYKILRHNPAHAAPAPVALAVESAPVMEIVAEAVIETPVEEPIPEAAIIEATAETIIETPVEETVAETPVEEPVAETPSEEPVAETPAEEPVAETPAEEAVAETPAEEPVTETPAEEPVVETPAEEPVAETPVEEPVVETPVEEPVVETPVEEPVVETPAEDEENKKDENNSGTMAEAEGAPAFDQSAMISEEITPESVTTETPAEQPMIAATMDVLFIATKKSDVALHADIIRKAGLNPVLADIRCLSLKHALESNPKIFSEIRQPYAFLEFGPDENYVFVIDGEHTDIYPIYMSEDDISNLIYSAEDVEKIKLFAQNYGNQALQILKDHQDKYQTDAIIHIFITTSAPLHVNDASAEPTMKIFVRETKSMMTGRTVKECDFMGHIEVPEQFAKQVNAEGNIAAWATVVGIATRKFDIFDYEKEESRPLMNMVNLITNYKLFKKDKITGALSTMGGIATLSVFLAAIGISYMSLASLSHKLSDNIQSMNTVESTYNTTLENAQKLTILMNQVKSLDDIQASLPSNQPALITTFKHISESFPEGIILNEVTFENPNRITIDGISVNDHNILNFVEKLNSKPELMKVSIKTMETETKKETSPIPGVPGTTSSQKKFTIEGIITVKDINGKAIEILGKRG